MLANHLPQDTLLGMASDLRTVAPQPDDPVGPDPDHSTRSPSAVESTTAPTPVRDGNIALVRQTDEPELGDHHEVVMTTHTRR